MPILLVHPLLSPSTPCIMAPVKTQGKDTFGRFFEIPKCRACLKGVDDRVRNTKMLFILSYTISEYTALHENASSL